MFKKRFVKGMMAVMMVFTLASSTQAASNEVSKVNQPNQVQANENYLFNFWHNGLEANSYWKDAPFQVNLNSTVCGKLNVNQVPANSQNSGFLHTSVNLLGNNGQIYSFDGITGIGTYEKSFCLQPGTYTVKYINNSSFPINILGYFTY
ncbi:hypothetical protein [Brevibacillus brevis]|uniref:hypothetical protein n=1 Tax=Brevibacillus brevis TaxID=1393 RepID=UPI00115C336B|nr:hypothetical protein [Lysinibacillus sp. SDF0063]TQR35672.1 hypothetical protein C7Y45_15160 [Lysinibacillus sp. SDF0063]